MKAIFILLSSVFFGCTAHLGPVANYDRSAISIVDLRKEGEKKEHRQGLSPTTFLGDDSIELSPLDLFVTYLLANRPSSVEFVELRVTQLRFIDHFPERQRAATAGAVAGATGMIWTFDGPRTDRILCLFEGSVNGNDVTAQGDVPYEASSIAIRRDEGFKSAIRNCAESLSTRAWAQ